MERTPRKFTVEFKAQGVLDMLSAGNSLSAAREANKSPSVCLLERHKARRKWAKDACTNSL